MGNTNPGLKGPEDFQPKLLKKSSSLLYGNEFLRFFYPEIRKSLVEKPKTTRFFVSRWFFLFIVVI